MLVAIRPRVIFPAALCALLLAPTSGPSQTLDVYDPSIPWQTRQGSLLCPSYFAIKDGLAAASSGDQNWLKQTGCVVARGGVKIVLIDAPYNPRGSDGIWRGRIYPNDTAAFDAYFDAFYAVSFARGGAFKDEAEAEKTFALMKKRFLRYFSQESKMEHRIVSALNPVTLFIGPDSFSQLKLFCDAATNYEAYRAHSSGNEEGIKRTPSARPTCEVPARQ